MAFTDLSLVISSAAPTPGTGTDLTFNRVATEPFGSRRRNTLSDSIDPNDLVVRHQIIQVGPSRHPADRHLLQFSRRKHETTGEEKDLVVNFTVQKPHSTLFTNADVSTRLHMLCNLLLASGNMDAFLRGES